MLDAQKLATLVTEASAVPRLARLLDAPQDIPVLAPIVEKELLYRLLTGPLGDRLRQAVVAGSHSHQIARAIDWLRGNLDRTVRIDTLAELANMSRSSLHHHFKTLTAMAPVQYRKQLRLQEARRLMQIEDHDAVTAASSADRRPATSPSCAVTAPRGEPSSWPQIYCFANRSK